MDMYPATVSCFLVSQVDASFPLVKTTVLRNCEESVKEAQRKCEGSVEELYRRHEGSVQEVLN